MKMLLTLIALLLFGIVLLLVIIIVQDRRILLHKRRKEQFDVERYFQLKLRLDLIIAISIIIAAAAGFYGIDTRETIDKKLDSGLNGLQDRIDDFDSRIESYQEKFDTISNGFSDVENRTKSATALMEQQSLDINNLSNHIDKLRSTEFLPKNIYYVSQFKAPIREKSSLLVTVKFSDLTTVSGNPLPFFQTAPVVIPFFTGETASDIYGSASVLNVTRESFDIQGNTNINDLVYYNLLIIYPAE